MTRSPSRPLRLALGLLALWLGLWPAGDAVSGSSFTMVMPETAPPPCCSGPAQDPPDCAAGARNGCDAMAKHCRCLLLGGLAFHAAERLAIGPDPASSGLPAPAAVFAPTREPEPPEHPPTVPA